MNACIYLLAFVLLLPLTRSDAAIRVFQTAGNWSSASNWQGNMKPVSGDDVVIAANCTVDENIAVYTFLTLTVNTGINLNLQQYQLVFSGQVTNNGFIYTECTLNPPIPAGKTWGSYVIFSASGAQTIPSGAYYSLKTAASGTSRIVSAGGDITVTNDLLVEGFTSANESIFDLGTWRLLGSPVYTWITGRLRTANTSAAPLPAGMRWYSNMPMRQGLVEFYALSPQSIPGGVYDSDVLLTGGTKTLTGVMQSNGNLTLAQAILVIQDSNAVIGVTGSISPGAAIFSSSNMIATMGSGYLVRQINGGGSHTWPIGDMTGTHEYSPATLTFPNIPGLFTVGVRTVNAKHPQNVSTASYINRYWSVDVLSPVARNGNAEFTYTAADVVGPEHLMYAGQWDGSHWQQRNQTDTLLKRLSASAVPLSGDFTGYESPPALTCTIDARILLQGPTIDSSGAMHTLLNTANVLPLQQPYASAPWNYPGNESVTAMPTQVVDWVLLELRTTPSGSAADRRAALLLAGGVVTDTDGVSAVSFPTAATGNYYLVVRHRNHLAIMSASPIQVSHTTPRYDFTTAQAQAWGSEAMTGLGGGVRPPFAMWGGDVNADGLLKYSGSGNDVAPIMARIGGADITATTTGYHGEDATMDGVVRFSGAGNDRAMILRNIGGIDITQQRSAQLP
jgi:hypothetical protein